MDEETGGAELEVEGVFEEFDVEGLHAAVGAAALGGDDLAEEVAAVATEITFLAAEDDPAVDEAAAAVGAVAFAFIDGGATVVACEETLKNPLNQLQERHGNSWMRQSAFEGDSLKELLGL